MRTFLCSLRTDPAPLRRGVGSAGTVLRSLRKLGGGRGFRAVREGFWCSPPRLATDRSRFAWRVGGSAGSILHSLKRLWGGWGVRSAPTGHCKPARGETPGMAHERSVLKERRIPPDRLWAWSLRHLRTPFCCGSEGHVRRLLTWRRISPSASASSSVLPSPGLLQPGSGGFLLRPVRRGFQ